MDNRDLAAEWLIRNAPRGSSVGMNWPEGYHCVPVNRTTYSQKLIDWDLAQFKAVKPDYFVMTELEYREYLRVPDRHPQQTQFVRALLLGSGQVGDARYRRIWFDHRPSVLGLGWDHRWAAQDWFYPFPRVVVLKRDE